MLIRTPYPTAIALMLATGFAAAQGPSTGSAPAAQSDTAPAPEVTFRTEVNYVEEDVRVVDGKGNFVRNLPREDFPLPYYGKAHNVSTLV